jgi:hypothetical protein
MKDTNVGMANVDVDEKVKNVKTLMSVYLL